MRLGGFGKRPEEPPVRGMPGGLLQRQRECVMTNHLDDQQKALDSRFLGGADRRTIEDFFHP